MPRYWVLPRSLLVSILLICMGCNHGADGSARVPARRAVVATTDSEVAIPMVASAETTPSEADTLEDIEADLDGDGLAEQVAARLDDGQLSITISRAQGGDELWRMQFPEGLAFQDLIVQDINGDGGPEVLVETTEQGDRTNFRLAMVKWTGSGSECLVRAMASDEPCAMIQSQYYRPWLNDLDGDGALEIIVGARKGDSPFVDSIVYTWNGEQYVQTTMFIVAPRVPPTPEP